MFYSYSSGYHIPSSPSLPGAWSSAWSLPQQHLEYEALEVAETKRVNDSSDCQEPTSSSKTDLPGALLAQHHTSYLSLSQSSLASSEHDHDAISDSNTSPAEYDSPLSCLSHKSTPLTSQSNDSLDTLSLFPRSVSNSPNSVKLSISSEIGDINSCDSLTDITPSRNNPLLDTLLDQTGHIPRVVNTGRDYSPEPRFYPNSLLLSQPDGKNTWTLFLDPTVSHPATISESSRSLTSASDEAITRTFPSISSTPRRNASLFSLPSSQRDIAKFSASSDMIVSSTCSLQQRQGGGGIISDTDLYFNDLPHGLVSHCQPRLDRVLDPQQQPSRSKKLINKSKNIFGRFKKLFTPKGTISEDVHTSTAHQSTISFPSLGQSFSLVDEKYTYEYHARPKTLKEIKSQRRFSLPFGFVGTSSRVTPPSTKRNVTTSVSRSQSRIYIASQNEFAA